MEAQILSSLGQLAKVLVPFLVGALAVMLGLWLMFSAVRAMYEMHNTRPDQGMGTLTWGRIAGQCVIGAMLMRYAATMQDLSMLMFGEPIQDSSAVMAYFPAAQGMGKWSGALQVALLWVVTMGWIFGIRGLLQWNKAISGGGSAGSNSDLMWAGTWHLVGGAAMVNLSAYIKSFLG